MRRILVTGGAGFVGRHLVALLSSEDEVEIWIIDDLSTGQHPQRWHAPQTMGWHEEADSATFQIAGTLARVIFLQADVLNIMLGELGRIPSGDQAKLPQFDEVYHLASIVGGRATIENDPLLVGIDLAIDSVFFLWAAKVNRPKRLMYASSSAAYPIGLQENGSRTALREDMIGFESNFGMPDLTYGWSKLTGEYLARVAVAQYGLSVATVRPFSGYGEEQDPSYPFPAIALRVAARHNPVVVWGNGSQARDFVHIDDAVRACVLACRSISNGRAVNIGVGIPVSMHQLAERMIAIEGFKAEVKSSNDRPVGVAVRYCDPSAASTLLGWEPLVSLDDGIQRCLAVAKRRLAAGVSPPD